MTALAHHLGASQEPTDATSVTGMAERFANLTRRIGADLAELVQLERAHGYELPEAVELAAAVLPRPGEPDPVRSKHYNDWLDRLHQSDPYRADLIENVMDLCTPIDHPSRWHPSQEAAGELEPVDHPSPEVAGEVGPVFRPDYRTTLPGHWRVPG